MVPRFLGIRLHNAEYTSCPFKDSVTAPDKVDTGSPTFGIASSRTHVSVRSSFPSVWSVNSVLSMGCLVLVFYVSIFPLRVRVLRAFFTSRRVLCAFLYQFIVRRCFVRFFCGQGLRVVLFYRDGYYLNQVGSLCSRFRFINDLLRNVPLSSRRAHLTISTIATLANSGRISSANRSTRHLRFYPRLCNGSHGLYGTTNGRNHFNIVPMSRSIHRSNDGYGRVFW